MCFNNLFIRVQVKLLQTLQTIYLFPINTPPKTILQIKHYSEQDWEIHVKRASIKGEFFIDNGYLFKVKLKLGVGETSYK